MLDLITSGLMKDSKASDDLLLANVSDRLVFRRKTYRLIQIVKNNQVVKYIKDPDNIYAVYPLLLKINGDIVQLNLEEIHE